MDFGVEPSAVVALAQSRAVCTRRFQWAPEAADVEVAFCSEEGVVGPAQGRDLVFVDQAGAQPVAILVGKIEVVAGGERAVRAHFSGANSIGVPVGNCYMGGGVGRRDIVSGEN